MDPSSKSKLTCASVAETKASATKLRASFSLSEILALAFLADA